MGSYLLQRHQHHRCSDGLLLQRYYGPRTQPGFLLAQAGSRLGLLCLNVDASLLANSPNGVNITLNIAALAPGSASMASFRGPTINVANPPIFHQEPAKAPAGPALYIGLPTVLGFVTLVLIGTWLWNRSERRIGLGNIMSRSRHGYVSKSATRDSAGHARRGSGYSTVTCTGQRAAARMRSGAAIGSGRSHPGNSLSNPRHTLGGSSRYQDEISPVAIAMR